MPKPYAYAPGQTTQDLIDNGTIQAPTYSGMTTATGSSGTVPPDLLTGVAANLRAANAGELPADVQQMLAQRAAELGIASGTSGSEFNKFRSLRDLGLTSLARQDFATNQLMGQFMTPYQQASLARSYSQDFQNDNAAFQARANGGWGPGAHTGGIMPEVPAYVRGQPPANPMAGRPAVLPGNDVNALVSDLFTKYGRGGSGGGMASMGAGTIPGSGVADPWNAGPVGGNDQFQAGLEYQNAAEGGWGVNSADPYGDWSKYS